MLRMQMVLLAGSGLALLTGAAPGPRTAPPH
jgi:hypothetical protein